MDVAGVLRLRQRVHLVPGPGRRRARPGRRRSSSSARGSSCGVTSAVSTGQSRPTSYCPGGSRSGCAGRLRPVNPRVTFAIRCLLRSRAGRLQCAGRGTRGGTSRGPRRRSRRGRSASGASRGSTSGCDRAGSSASSRARARRPARAAATTGAGGGREPNAGEQRRVHQSPAEQLHRPGRDPGVEGQHQRHRRVGDPAAARVEPEVRGLVGVVQLLEGVVGRRARP